MKEMIEPFAQDKKGIIAEQAQHKFKIIGQLQAVRGLILWDFDPETNVLAPAQYTMTYDVTTKESIKNVISKEGHIYLQALNQKNAARKIAKARGG